MRRQAGKARLVGFMIAQAVAVIDEDRAFEAAASGRDITAAFVYGGEQTENRSFRRFVSQLDVVFRPVVQAAFSPGEISLVQKTAAHLAVGEGEAFFVADDAVRVKRILEMTDRSVPLLLPGLFHPEVVI